MVPTLIYFYCTYIKTVYDWSSRQSGSFHDSVAVMGIKSAEACFSVTSSLFQRAQVQEKNQSLRQQPQCAGLMSGDVSEDLQRVRNKQPVQHIRLKQAAFCIARLIKEKQQLIDIGNHLRGMISTAGFKGASTHIV